MSCLGRALLDALEDGDERRALQVVARGADLEEMNQGQTPLLLACSSGLTLVAKELVRRGTNLEAREPRRGFRALHLASARKDASLVRELLEHHAQVDPLGRQGETPVHLASLMGHHEVLELLLEAQASPNLLALDGKGALSHACYRGHQEVARCLVRYKARAETDAQGRRPLHWAAEQGCEAVLDVLLPDASINTQDSSGASALHLAAQRGHVPLLQRLLEARAALDLQGHQGETALMLAALNGQVEALQCLAQARANLNIVAHDGFDALHLASEAQHFEATEVLLALGAEVPPEGLVLPLSDSLKGPEKDELVLTKSLAKQLLLETQVTSHAQVARQWGFGDGQGLLEAIANAGCPVPEELQTQEEPGGLFDWDAL